MVYYRPKSLQVLTRHTRIYKPKSATKQTKLGLQAYCKPATCCTRYVHKLKDMDKHEHFIEHLVYIFVRDRTALRMRRTSLGGDFFVAVFSSSPSPRLRRQGKEEASTTSPHPHGEEKPRGLLIRVGRRK
ncbi:hypothetical protein BHE74_00056602 [Ensete ventricosum]|nr:hypothetical protein BHE74_00056602 [Ensete ventricosum]